MSTQREDFDKEVERRIANDLITRDEFKSEITRVEAVLSTQIGAVEKTFVAKLGSIKAWGIAALVGGQTLAGILASVVGPSHAYHAALHVLQVVALH